MSSRAPIGLLSIAKTSLCTNQGFKSLIPRDIKASEYLYYYIKYHIPQIQQLGTGTTFKEVSRDDMARFKILCPEDITLSKWHNKVSSIFNKQFAAVKEVEELTKLRDELLPLLMNGQLSVKQLNFHLYALSHSVYCIKNVYGKGIDTKNIICNGFFAGG